MDNAADSFARAEVRRLTLDVGSQAGELAQVRVELRNLAAEVRDLRKQQRWLGAAIVAGAATAGEGLSWLLAAPW
jgi:hypothetical protein